MKKIKYLLGFSIVGVGLLINNIFSYYDVGSCYIQYADSNNNTIFFNTCRDNEQGGYFSGFYDVAPDYMLVASGAIDSPVSYILNFNNYILTGYISSLYYYSNIYLSFNSITIPYGDYSHLRLFKPTNGQNYSGDLSFIIKSYPSDDFTTYFLHINGDSSCINKDVLLNGNCNFDSYVFGHKSIPYSIINGYSVHDSMFDGVEYYKGDVVFSTKNTYSFGFTNYSGTIYNNNWSDPDTFVNFRSVFYTDTMEDVQYIDGIYFARLYDNLYVNNSSDFKIIGIFGSGADELDYQLLYNIYNCPSIALTPYDCSFLTGGYLLPSSGTRNYEFNTGDSFASCNSGSLFCAGSQSSLPLLLSYPNIYPDISNTSLSFWTYNSENGYLLYHTSYFGNNEFDTYSARLSNSPVVSDILSGTTPPDLPDDTAPTYSGSITFSDCVDTEVCYDTTGENDEVYRVCTSRCLSTGVIESGSFVGSDGTLYYVNSTYDVSNLIHGSSSYLFDTGYLDSDGMLSVDYYSGLFNGGGFKLGVCPYPKSTFFSFVTNIKIGGFYPLMPLNCFYSAYIQGLKIHYFDDFGLFPDLDSQLINGDTHFHKTIYRFFDILLSIGLLLILSSLYRMIKK